MTIETFELTMKDNVGNYGWMLEGCTSDDIKGIESMGIEKWLKSYVETAINAQNYGDTTDAQVYQTWIDEADEFDEIVAYIQGKIEEVNDDKALNAVATVTEVAERFDIKEDTVRDAIEHGWLIARKSGATWLILRKYAEKRWGKK